MPSYHSERASVLYSVLFIVLGAYFFLNVVLVVVLIFFKQGLQNSADRYKAGRMVNLFKAFDILDVDKRGYVTRQQVMGLLSEIFNNYSDFRQLGVPDERQMSIMVEAMDLQGKCHCSM